MVVQATYTDGTKKEVTDYRYYSNYAENPGKSGIYQTITVAYTEDSITKTDTFRVWVLPFGSGSGEGDSLGGGGGSLSD